MVSLLLQALILLKQLVQLLKRKQLVMEIFKMRFLNWKMLKLISEMNC